MVIWLGDGRAMGLIEMKRHHTRIHQFNTEFGASEVKPAELINRRFTVANATNYLIPF